MKVFQRPGPINTDEVINILKKSSSDYDYLVVASVTGESAVKIAERINDIKIVCVTCPQGMYWEVEGMDNDLFSEIPELQNARDEWVKNGQKRVPMNITPEKGLNWMNYMLKLFVELSLFLDLVFP